MGSYPRREKAEQKARERADTVPALDCQACGALTPGERFRYFSDQIICEACDERNPQSRRRDWRSARGTKRRQVARGQRMPGAKLILLMKRSSIPLRGRWSASTAAVTITPVSRRMEDTAAGSWQCRDQYCPSVFAKRS